MADVSDVLKVLAGIGGGGGVAALFNWFRARARARTENAKLKQAEIADAAAVRSELLEIVYRLQGRVETLESQLEASRQAQSTLRAENTELKARCKQLEGEVAELQRQQGLTPHGHP